MTLLLQILVIYVATSLTVGLLFAAALGRLVRRSDRRREYEVALLARFRTVQAVGLQRVSPPAVGTTPHDEPVTTLDTPASAGSRVVIWTE